MSVQVTGIVATLPNHVFSPHPATIQGCCCCGPQSTIPFKKFQLFLLLVTTTRNWAEVLYVYALDFLKQSKHFKLLVSRGVNGRLVMGPPHILQVQLPATFGLSVAAPFASGDPAVPVLAPLPFAWHSRHMRPFVLRGSKGNSVIALPHPLQVQFPWCILFVIFSLYLLVYYVIYFHKPILQRL